MAKRTACDKKETNAVWRRLELPTWAVATAVYLGFGLLTWHYHALPIWLLPLLGGWFVCWHGSLQHEIVHGHPTRWSWLNAAIAMPSLALWLPYTLYREIHIAHHRTDALTCPDRDPESFYVRPENWARFSRPHRWLLRVMNTLAGRLVLGPIYVCVRFWHAEFRRIAAGDRRRLGHWLLHAAAVTPVLYWTLAVCQVPLWSYLLFFVWPGISLTLLRSFAEHRAAADPDHRTAVIESNGLMSLLFLNNNLHAVHHDDPRLAWYELPRAYRAARGRIAARNGGYVLQGYAELAWRFLLRPKDSPVQPRSAVST